MTGLLLTSILGFSSALALVLNNGSGSATGLGVDQAVYINWGSNAIGDIENLTPTNPGYATIVFTKPEKSATAPGHDELTFTLAAAESKTLNGVEVLIADEVWGLQTATDYKVRTSDPVTIAPDWATGSPTMHTYYLKFTITTEAYDAYVAAKDNPDAVTMDGTLTVDYNWVTGA